jgi:protein-tyrosine-phosphatase
MRRLRLIVLCCSLLLAAFAAEHRITPAQEQQLFNSVDNIIRFLSFDLKVPANLNVKRKIVSQEELRTAAETQLTDPKTQEQRHRGEAVLRKLGFIPRDYDMLEFARNMQSDSILGLYSPSAKTIFITDTVETGRQQAVLAHELMHAVQDENVNLREYVTARAKDAPPLNDADEDVYDPSYDDGQLARRAVVEGEAMVAMYEYVVSTARDRVRFTGQSTQSEVQRALESAFPRPKKDELWKNAPLYLKESVVFPYNEGFKFVWALKQEEGNEIFTRLLKDPPHSTQEVYAPARYKHHHADEQPFRPPKITPLVAPSYVPLAVATMGEFDVDVFLRQFAGNGKAAKIAPKWNGGVLFAARKADSTIDKLTPADIALAYVSRWQDDNAAKRFAEAWTEAVPKRYAGAKHSGVAFETSEGPVTVEQHGDIVLVVESFPADLALKIKGAVFATQTAAK